MLHGTKGSLVILATVAFGIGLLFSCAAFSTEITSITEDAADGITSEVITVLLSIGTAIGGLIVWLVKRLVNILASEMDATRVAFTDTLTSLREADSDERAKDRHKDAEERAKDRLEFAHTLRTILLVKTDGSADKWDSA